MKKSYVTVVTTITPTGQIRHWPGPIIKAKSFTEAQEKLEQSGRGYCSIAYEVVYEDPDYHKNLTPLDLLSLKSFFNKKIEC